MIIQASGVATLADYLNCAGKVHETPAEKCFHCLDPDHLQGHGHYWRGAKEGDLRVRVKIHRILCSACSRTFSVLFQFLVPRKHYTAQVIATAIRRYLFSSKPSSRRVAGALASLKDDTSALSHTTVMRWVGGFCRKSKSKLQTKTQRLCVASSVSTAALEAIELRFRRQSDSKDSGMDSLLTYGKRVVLMAMLLSRGGRRALKALHNIFLKQLLPESIFGGQVVKLLNPQSLEHLIN